jgi:hypothetical protein
VRSTKRRRIWPNKARKSHVDEPRWRSYGSSSPKPGDLLLHFPSSLAVRSTTGLVGVKKIAPAGSQNVPDWLYQGAHRIWKNILPTSRRFDSPLFSLLSFYSPLPAAARCCNSIIFRRTSINMSPFIGSANSSTSSTPQLESAQSCVNMFLSSG